MNGSSKSLKVRYFGDIEFIPNTGYGIKKYCDTILKNFWNENYGHIYPTLKKMTKDGLIKIKDSTGNDNRVTHAITESGLNVFDKWLKEDVYQPIRSEFTLKLFFSNSLTKYEIIKKLVDYKER